MRLPILFIAFALFVRCQPTKSQPQENLESLPQIAGPLLLQDLELFKTEMEAYHPGLFWYQSATEWNALINQAREQIGNGADLLSFYRTLSLINANIGCGHTGVRLGRDYRDSWMDTARILPLEVRLLDQRIIVTHSLTGDRSIPAGSEIISINDHPSQHIQEQVTEPIGMDGFNQTGKYHRASRGFSLRYLYQVDPLADGYQVVYREPGTQTDREVDFPGIPFEAYEREINRPGDPLLSFSPLNQRSGTYYMQIRTFASSWMRSEGFNYFAFLKDAFEQLSANNARHLILDLRGNGGGDDGNGSQLMSYLVDQPFGYYRSIEVKPGYDGWGSPVQTEDGRYLLTGHSDLETHHPDQNNFKGHLYILIDGGSFSATSEFAALIHDRDRATFIGQETGGGYYGNSSGNRRRVTLSNSALEVSIPYWKYLVDIDGNDYYGKGVEPTHDIEQTVADLLDNRDTALEFALDLIGKRN